MVRARIVRIRHRPAAGRRLAMAVGDVGGRTMSPPMIAVEGLAKRYRSGRVAVDGIDFEVSAGSVLALLGPNGAGKTTTVRLLSTLLRPDAGRARIAGADVVRQADTVRRSIGICAQHAALDERLTARENL